MPQWIEGLITGFVGLSVGLIPYIWDRRIKNRALSSNIEATSATTTQTMVDTLLKVMTTLRKELEDCLAREYEHDCREIVAHGIESLKKATKEIDDVSGIEPSAS